jgi:hypothetical protein
MTQILGMGFDSSEERFSSMQYFQTAKLSVTVVLLDDKYGNDWLLLALGFR